MQLRRDLYEAAQSHALHGYRIPPPKRGEIDAVSVARGDHGEAGQSALRRLRLPDQREVPAAAEIQQPLHAPHILALTMGSSSHVISERLSRMTSALSSMSGCSGTFCP